MRELQAKDELTPEDYEKLLRLEELEAQTRDLIDGSQPDNDDGEVELPQYLLDAARAQSRQKDKYHMPDTQCAQCSSVANSDENLVGLNCEHFIHQACLYELFNQGCN